MTAPLSNTSSLANIRVVWKHATAHWMFDRGLISLSDGLEILISRQVNDLDSVQGFVNKTLRALSPRRQSERPHPRFLQWHREHCFKQ